MINVALDAMGMAVILTLLMGALLSGQKRERKGRFFVALLILTMVQQLSDILNWLFEGKPELSSALFWVNFLIFICGPITALVFFHYTLSLIAAEPKRYRKGSRIAMAFCVLWIGLNVLNVFNNMFYGVNAAGSYYRGPVYILEHVYHFVVILVSTVLALGCRKLPPRQKLALLTYALLPFAALLFQVWFYGLSSLTYCALTLSMQLIYITVHLSNVAQLERQGEELSLTRQAYQQTLYDAETDDLTGLLKRKVFVQKVEKYLAGQRDNSCAMWMIDIDRFKSVNDELGHAVGDEVLAAVAHKLVMLLPEDALVARYGGDEFCAFLPQVTLEELYHTLQSALTALYFPCGNGSREVMVSVSLGAAYAPAEKSIACPELFRQADEALYTSKKKGRNQYSLKEL